MKPRLNTQPSTAQPSPRQRLSLCILELPELRQETLSHEQTASKETPHCHLSRVSWPLLQGCGATQIQTRAPGSGASRGVPNRAPALPVLRQPTVPMGCCTRRSGSFRPTTEDTGAGTRTQGHPETRLGAAPPPAPKAPRHVSPNLAVALPEPAVPCQPARAAAGGRDAARGVGGQGAPLTKGRERWVLEAGRGLGAGGCQAAPASAKPRRGRGRSAKTARRIRGRQKRPEATHSAKTPSSRLPPPPYCKSPGRPRRPKSRESLLQPRRGGACMGA